MVTPSWGGGLCSHCHLLTTHLLDADNLRIDGQVTAMVEELPFEMLQQGMGIHNA